MNRHPVILKIQEVIKGTKYEQHVFVAGGFVRDYFLDRPSKDIDLLVTGHGLQGGVDFAWFLYRIIGLDHSPVTFERFGTAQIKILDIDVEVVAARKESYNLKDRNPIVEEGTMDDDINRRDFTINAILYDISKGVFVDLVGGIKDIKSRKIQTTGDPDVIFAEDPLRIMRAIRFASQLGFKISKDTDKSIKKFTPWLKNISNERIRDEFNKILISDDVVGGLNRMKYAGILEYMIPEFKALYEIKNQGKYHPIVKDAWNHTLEVVMNVPATIEHRLAALLHDIGKGSTMSVDENGDVHFNAHQHVSRKIAHRFMTKYKYATDQINLVSHAIVLHMNFINGMLPKTIRKMINEIGKDAFLFAIDLAEADSKRRDRITIVQNVRNFVLTDNHIPEQHMKMVVDGNEIMKRYDLKPSKKVGELLTIQKEYLFEHPDADEDEILRLLDLSMVDEDGTLTIYRYIKPEKPAEYISINIPI